MVPRLMAGASVRKAFRTTESRRAPGALLGCNRTGFAASAGATCSELRPADLTQRPLEGRAIDAVEGEAGEVLDAAAQLDERRGKRGALFLFAAFHRGGVRHAPVRRHGLAGKDRADLAGRVVADRDHEVDRRSALARELLPALAAHAVDRVPVAHQHIDGERVHATRRVAAGAERLEAAAAQRIEDRLGDDRARRVGGAEEEDSVGPWHDRALQGGGTSVAQTGFSCVTYRDAAADPRNAR